MYNAIDNTHTLLTESHVCNIQMELNCCLYCRVISEQLDSPTVDPRGSVSAK